MLDRMLRAILVFSLYLSFIAAISRNGIQGPMIFRIVWFYISVQSARSRLHMCWWDQTQVSYALFSTRMSTHTMCESACTRAHTMAKFVLSSYAWSIVYWWSKGNGGKRDRKRVRGWDERSCLSLTLSLLLPHLHPRHSFIFYFQKSWRCSFFWLVKNSSNWRVTKRSFGF